MITGWGIQNEGGGIGIFGSKHHTKHGTSSATVIGHMVGCSTSGFQNDDHVRIPTFALMSVFKRLPVSRNETRCLHCSKKKPGSVGENFFPSSAQLLIGGGGVCITLPEFYKVFLTTRSKVKHRVKLLSSTRLWSDLVCKFIYEVSDRVKDRHTLKVWYIMMWISPWKSFFCTASQTVFSSIYLICSNSNLIYWPVNLFI